jgi:hypothetical protein
MDLFAPALKCWAIVGPARVIEINSATSQSTQMQGLNHKILDLEHEVDGVKRERDRIEDWVLNRSTNTLPAFFTYSGTNTVTVTNYLPSAVLQNRVLSPEVVQAVKFTFGLQTNRNYTINIVSTKGDKESYALAGQIKNIFSDLGYKIDPVTEVVWRAEVKGIIISANNNLLPSPFANGFSQLNREINGRILFDVETNMPANQITIYVCPQ